MTKEPKKHRYLREDYKRWIADLVGFLKTLPKRRENPRSPRHPSESVE